MDGDAAWHACAKVQHYCGIRVSFRFHLPHAGKLLTLRRHAHPGELSGQTKDASGIKFQRAEGEEAAAQTTDFSRGL
jgi:hypothetical protein